MTKPANHNTSQHQKGFTLIELLVVISIISLLVGILLPALGAARQRARDIQCQSTIRGQAQGFLNYSMDNKNWFLHGPISMSNLGGGNAWGGGNRRQAMERCSNFKQWNGASPNTRYYLGGGLLYRMGYISGLQGFICPARTNLSHTFKGPGSGALRNMDLLTYGPPSSVIPQGVFSSYMYNIYLDGQVDTTAETLMTGSKKWESYRLGDRPGRAFIADYWMNRTNNDTWGFSGSAYDQVMVPHAPNDTATYVASFASFQSANRGGVNVAFEDSHVQYASPDRYLYDNGGGNAIRRTWRSFSIELAGYDTVNDER